MATWYRVWSYVSLVLFIFCSAIHVMALSEIYVVPKLALFPLAFVIMPGQLLLIVGFNGNRLIPERRRRFQLCSTWRVFVEGLRTIPLGWRVFGLLYWYLYAPVMFLLWVGTAKSGSQPYSVDAATGATVILAAFPLIHYLGLRYVVPNREAILARLNVAREGVGR